jgi:predicted MFS family arabinose efflux permease
LLLLAAVQFTHIVDFMVLMPLGPQLMRDLHIGPGQFSALVAAYTVSSGVVGMLTAPFIDRFDRRVLLLFAYAGFSLGTVLCALSQNAPTLLTARAVSGAFGGLSMSMVMSIIGDVVPAERRAAAMGIVMTAFSAAAALGVPFGLQLAQHFRWEAPFFLVVVIASGVWTLAFLRLPPVRGHLDNGQGRRAFTELLGDANAARGLAFIATTVVGHFTIIPLLSPHLVFDLGFPERDLFLAYFTGGVLTVFTAPYIGRLADSLGRFQVFAGLVGAAIVVTLVITHTGPVPVWVVLALCGLFFVFASGRFVPAQAIMTLAVPASRRGAFMSLSGVARDLAMGFSASLSGWIVTKTPSGGLANFEWLGWVAAAAGLVSVWLGSRVRVNESASPNPGQAELDVPTREPSCSRLGEPDLAER